MTLFDIGNFIFVDGNVHAMVFQFYEMQMLYKPGRKNKFKATVSSETIKIETSWHRSFARRTGPSLIRKHWRRKELINKIVCLMSISKISC